MNSAAVEALVLARGFWSRRGNEPELPDEDGAVTRGGACSRVGFIRADDLQARVGFFAFSLTFLLSSTAATMAGLITEREIAMKENSRGVYRLSSYSLATAVVFLPALLAAAMMFAAPAYWWLV